MATWHPPIPAKKLYSKEALDLGAGLALLVWCYDGIERDGHVDIELNKLTAEFGVSYRTIKDWWAALRDGSFFSRKEDRGRKGWRVWLADEWIDWHVMANNYLVAQGQKSAPEDNAEGPLITLEELEGPLKSRSRSRQGQDTALESSAYKEDHHDQNPKGGRRAQKRDPPAQTNIDSLHEGVAIYKRLTGKKTVPPIVATAIAEKVTDCPRFENAATAWIKAGFKPDNITGIMDWYEHPEKMERRNGTHQSNRPRTAHPNAPSRHGYAIERPDNRDPDDSG